MGVLVYEHAGRPVGLIAFQMTDLLERARPQCRVTALAVTSDQRRRGVARTLLESVEAVARERGCFRLEVTTHEARSAALAVYAAFGFRERPRRLVKRLGEAAG